MNNEEQITEKGGQSPAGEGSKRRVGFDGGLKPTLRVRAWLTNICEPELNSPAIPTHPVRFEPFRMLAVSCPPRSRF